MKQKLLNSLRLRLCLLVAALLCVGGKAWGETKTYDFGFTQLGNGWTNSYAQHIVDYTESTVTFTSASKQTGTITTCPVTKGQPVTIVMKDNYTISAASFECQQWGTKTQTITLHYSTDGGNNYTSTGITSANFNINSSSLPAGTNAVKITFSSTSNQVGIKGATITYSDGGSTVETCATPTFSPAAGTYTEAQNVTISCATEGATIYYTTDGSTPTTSSTQGTTATISESCTLKAMAVKEGLDNSTVATAEYTIVEPYANIAALVESATSTASTGYVTLTNAVVTYVNGNYAYIEDASSAIVMYKSGHGLTAGQVLNGTANVTYQLRNNNPQLTALSGVTTTDGTAPEPTEIMASAWNSSISAELSKYYKITGATITNNSGKYYITLGSETVQLYGQGNANPVSVSDLEATYTVIGFPTIYNSTLELQIFEQPTAETITRLELTMTFTGGTREFTDASNFVAPTLGITDEIGNTVSGLPITYESSNTSVANVDVSGNVTIGSEYGTAIITATFAGNDDYVGTTASYTIVYSNPNQGDYTWDLSKASHASASADLVTWSSGYATMTLSKGASSTDANNYLGGTNNHTRLYKDQILTIAPEIGYKVISITITAVSNYAAGFTGNTWTNATASASGSTITVVPTNASQAVNVTISQACRATGVKVTYELNNTPSIAITPTSVEATSDETSGTLAVSYLHIADNSTAAVVLCDADGNAATYDWIEVELNEDKNVEYLIGANTTSNNRTAYLKLTVGEIVSDVIAITQNKFVADYATLPFEFDGSDYTNINGLKGEGISAYSSSPKLKFDDTNDYLILKMNEAPKALYFDIKGNGFSGGTFKVQISADGNTYSDLATYTELNSDVQTELFTNFATDIRYIKWIYTNKSSGNVALGNIIATNVLPTENVSVGSTGFATFSCDKALDFTNVETIYAYTATVSGKEISFTRVNKVPANTGLLLRNPQAEAAAEANVPVIALAADIENNALVAVNEEIAELASDGEDGSKNYILNKPNGKNVGFFLAAGKKVGAGKAYLNVPAGASVKSFAEVFGGETDGVEAIENGQWTIDNAVIYNLAGQRLQKLQKGVNIIGGKKVVVK